MKLKMDYFKYILQLILVLPSGPFYLPSLLNSLLWEKNPRLFPTSVFTDGATRKTLARTEQVNAWPK